MARKRMNTALANGANTNTEVPNSPATSGAMDSLLEKLRAAAPQARDQRDRRRRARLKERHQVRVASGQHIPENLGAEEGANANEDENNTGQAKDDDNANATETGLLSPPGQDGDRGTASPEPQLSESEDVADRAASMLQGLRDNSGDSERSRRRRESAEEERRKRRLRRRNGATSGSKDSGDGTGGLSSVKEPEPTSPPATADSMDADDASSQPPSTPTIVVSSNADTDQHDRSPDDSRPSSKRDSEPSE